MAFSGVVFFFFVVFLIFFPPFGAKFCPWLHLQQPRLMSGRDLLPV